MADRMARCRLAILDAELFDNAMDMIFDCIDRDTKFTSDLFIAQVSLCDHSQDVELPTSQSAVARLYRQPPGLA